MHRSVGRVRGNVGQERLSGSLLRGNEGFRVVEKYVGAKTCCRFDDAIVPVAAVKVGVVPIVRGLANATTTVAEQVKCDRIAVLHTLLGG